ncbi:hypothetical protein BDQ17DRAFT_1431103 [Cyathus striatus]|nr:hypothetical protein BDQ17DRAFT_1431103 [Cyathus striatus]
MSTDSSCLSNPFINPISSICMIGAIDMETRIAMANGGWKASIEDAVQHARGQLSAGPNNLDVPSPDELVIILRSVDTIYFYVQLIMDRVLQDISYADARDLIVAVQHITGLVEQEKTLACLEALRDIFSERQLMWFSVDLDNIRKLALGDGHMKPVRNVPAPYLVYNT